MNELNRFSEKAKINELVREYKANGYKIVLQPGVSDLPEFLRSTEYRPDIIARSDKGNVIVEVLSRSSISDAGYLVKIAKLLDGRDDWRLEVVYTNPRKANKNTVRREKVPKSLIFESMTNVINWVNQSSDRESRIAQLLYCWSVFEAALYFALSENRQNENSSTLGMIRDAVISGAITKHTQQFLERLMKKRNMVAHGNLTEKISESDLNKLIETTEEIMAIYVD